MLGLRALKQLGKHFGLGQIAERLTRSACDGVISESEDQYFIAPKRCRDYLIVEIMVNRVHPDTYNSPTHRFDRRILDKAMSVIEHTQGWKQSVDVCCSDEEAEGVRELTREMRRVKRDSIAGEARRLAKDLASGNVLEDAEVASS